MLTEERPRTPTARSIEGLRNPQPPRTRGRRRLVGALLVVLVVVSGLAIPYTLGAFPWLYTPPLPDGVVIAVGDKEITQQQYDDRMKTVGALYGAKAPADPAGADQFRRDSAKALAFATVLQNAEAERNIVVPDTKVRDTLNNLVAGQFGPGPDGYQKFVQGLGEVGTSEGAVLEEIRQQMASTELISQVTQGVTVRDDELPAEFPKYRDKLGTPEKRQLSNIVVSTQDQANDVLAKLRAGTPFADLARQVSLDGSTKDKGGDLGEVSRDQLQSAYAAAAFGTPPGQFYGPVQTSQGWNVGQVVLVAQGVPADFNRVTTQLKQAVTIDRKVTAWSDYLSQRVRDSDIRYADAYRPQDPDGLPTALTQATS